MPAVIIMDRKVTNRYEHLVPGKKNEAAGLLDAYLEHADSQARIPQVAA
jgi:hypothetical protein